MDADRGMMKDRGFSLVELMVVLLIMTVLMGIAVPLFLGARVRAQDRAAQAAIRNALTVAKVFYSDNENFDATVAELSAIEPNLSVVLGNSPATPQVGYMSIADGDGDADQAVILLSKSASGSWFCIANQAGGSAAGVTYAKGSTGGAVDTLAECAATSW